VGYHLSRRSSIQCFGSVDRDSSHSGYGNITGSWHHCSGWQVRWEPPELYHEAERVLLLAQEIASYVKQRRKMVEEIQKSGSQRETQTYARMSKSFSTNRFSETTSLFGEYLFKTSSKLDTALLTFRHSFPLLPSLPFQIQPQIRSAGMSRRACRAPPPP